MELTPQGQACLRGKTLKNLPPPVLRAKFIVCWPLPPSLSRAVRPQRRFEGSRSARTTKAPTAQRPGPRVCFGDVGHPRLWGTTIQASRNAQEVPATRTSPPPNHVDLSPQDHLLSERIRSWRTQPARLLRPLKPSGAAAPRTGGADSSETLSSILWLLSNHFGTPWLATSTTTFQLPSGSLRQTVAYWPWETFSWPSSPLPFVSNPP